MGEQFPTCTYSGNHCFNANFRNLTHLTEKCECDDQLTFQAQINLNDDVHSSSRQSRSVKNIPNPINLNILNLDVQNLVSFSYDTDYRDFDIYKMRKGLIHAEVMVDPKLSPVKPEFLIMGFTT